MDNFNDDITGFGDNGCDDINPASGLPMIDNSCTDVAGNPYGTDSSNSFLTGLDDIFSSLGRLFNN